jgi:hypothetical protein
LPSDINGNFSHNIFTTAPAGLNIVDLDAAGEILSLAGRPEHIAIPVPSTVVLLGTGLLNFLGIGYLRRRREE